MDGWNEINYKSVERNASKKMLDGKRPLITAHLLKIQTQSNRGREVGGTEEGGWPSVRELKAMKHYARIMKMVLLCHTPH